MLRSLRGNAAGVCEHAVAAKPPCGGWGTALSHCDTACPSPQVALGAQAKDFERVTVFITNEDGAKFALGSLVKARPTLSLAAAAAPNLCAPSTRRQAPASSSLCCTPRGMAPCACHTRSCLAIYTRGRRGRLTVSSCV